MKIFLGFFSFLFVFAAIAVLWLQFDSQSEIDWQYCILFAFPLAFVGGSIGAVALPRAREIEAITPTCKLIGLRVATVGVLVAIAGATLAFAVSYGIGYWVALGGAVSGLIGILIHFYVLLFTRKN